MNMFTADACILFTIWLTGVFAPVLGIFEILIPAVAVYAVVLRMLQTSVEKKRANCMTN